MQKIILLLCLWLIVTQPVWAQLGYQQVLSYDQVALKPNTWQKVEMIYWVTINHKLYKNTIQLLRPKQYITQHHMNQMGHKVTLTLPEIGLNHIPVQIIAIQKAPAFKACYQQNCSHVIGIFKHYSTQVKTYRFKDLTTQKVSIIHATVNHPFYVVNEKKYLPISNISSTDLLIGVHNHIIKLLCSKKRQTHCGIDNLNSAHNPILVYNLEVYQQHNFKVSTNQIVVHNACDSDTDIDTESQRLLPERIRPDHSTNRDHFVSLYEQSTQAKANEIPFSFTWEKQLVPERGPNWNPPTPKRPDILEPQPSTSIDSEPVQPRSRPRCPEMEKTPQIDNELNAEQEYRIIGAEIAENISRRNKKIIKSLAAFLGITGIAAASSVLGIHFYEKNNNP